jgi:hypothetical protein
MAGFGVRCDGYRVRSICVVTGAGENVAEGPCDHHEDEGEHGVFCQERYRSHVDEDLGLF